ncbi:hypothetical protein RFI_32639, partial [Reticulomyxa filosa]
INGKDNEEKRMESPSRNSIHSPTVSLNKIKTLDIDAQPSREHKSLSILEATTDEIWKAQFQKQQRDLQELRKLQEQLDEGTEIDERELERPKSVSRKYQRNSGVLHTYSLTTSNVQTPSATSTVDSTKNGHHQTSPTVNTVASPTRPRTSTKL